MSGAAGVAVVRTAYDDAFDDDRAACKGMSDVLDPPGGLRGRAAEDRAKAVCWRCPALEGCFAWVIPQYGDRDPGGVIAGLTETERAQIRAEGTGTKRCSYCTRSKPRTEFYASSRTADGLRTECRDCAKARKRRTADPIGDTDQ